MNMSEIPDVVNTASIAGIFLLLAFIAVLLKKWLRQDYLPKGSLFRKSSVMNRTEQQLFHKLVIAFPQYHIFPQVPFSCIVEAKTQNYQEKQRLFWRINQKRVDFLICDRNLQSCFIVELDGSSHRNRHHRDKERDRFFQQSGLETVRFNTYELKNLTVSDIQSRVKLPH